MNKYVVKLESLARAAVALVKSNPSKRVSSVEIAKLTDELDRKIKEARVEYQKMQKNKFTSLREEDWLCIECNRSWVNPMDGEDTCSECKKGK